MLTSAPRLNRLDVLRAIAVFMVMGRHMYIAMFWTRTGWMGVDLFFVLSGFLVSGLLFGEHQRSGKLDVARFWVRRGFKIYPAFYFLLLVSALTGWHQQGSLLADALFFQNYVPGWWAHTWSLAVEEHFYLFAPLLLAVVARVGRGRRDPFTRLPFIVAGIGIAALALRGYTLAGADAHDPHFPFRQWATHLRIDALAFGMLISYVYRYRGEVIARLGKRQLGLVAAASAALILPCASTDMETSVSLAIWGYTPLYLGFGGVLIVFMQWPPLAKPGAWLARAGAGLGFVGRHSYSIYLWHLPIAFGVTALAERHAPRLPKPIVFVVYVVASVVVGVILGRLIEWPALRLRDRLFPARGPIPRGRPPVLPPEPPVPPAPAVPALTIPRPGGFVSDRL